MQFSCKDNQKSNYSLILDTKKFLIHAQEYTDKDLYFYNSFHINPLPAPGKVSPQGFQRTALMVLGPLVKHDDLEDHNADTCPE